MFGFTKTKDEVILILKNYTFVDAKQVHSNSNTHATEISGQIILRISIHGIMRHTTRSLVALVLGDNPSAPVLEIGLEILALPAKAVHLQLQQTQGPLFGAERFLLDRQRRFDPLERILP